MRFLSGYIIIIFVLLMSGMHGHAQPIVVKEIAAEKLREPIVLDGKLTETSWLNAAKAGHFVQYGPSPGLSSLQRTEVSVLYDDDAMYVGAMMFDAPDSILRQLTPRDQYEDQSTDAFGVLFDTYYDRQNATEFVVTAAGVQGDGIMKFSGRDFSWNAAWYSKVAIQEHGWSVEMKIPYSALRFSRQQAQTWGVNFYRIIRRYRERSYWSPVLPTVANTLNQSGKLMGIQDIKPPVRLAFLPYISAYAENYDGASTESLNGGLDIKYGINEAFTLDMTLVPDFGQTIYDNKVLNLSPIEVRYNENRYFFTEGLDLFNKNDLFYSRRVGGTPVNVNTVAKELKVNEIIEKNPATTRLYNATKVSGRTKRKLGIGFFNAVAEPSFAVIVDTSVNVKRKVQTAPLTNYNVVVLDQALKNNSYISLINTNVSRMENSYNANVSALLFKFADKNNKYGVSGSGDVSQRYFSGAPDVGHRYYLNAGKLAGNYTWSFSTKTISDNFNPNDLGYLDRNNLVYYVADQYYNLYEPKGIMRSMYNHVGGSYSRIYKPDAFFKWDIFGSHNLTLKNFTTIGFYWTLQPATSNDYLEPRTSGRYYVYPANYMAGGFYSSDYRKRFALDLELSNRWFLERNRNSLQWSLSPRFRFNDKLSAIYSLSGQTDRDDVGFLANRNDSIYFGVRNVKTITNSLYAIYVFNNKMSLKLDARHYWSQAVYSQFVYLTKQGALEPTAAYRENRNINFNTFNVYMSYIWQFRPGSEMAIVYQNSVFSSPNAPKIINNYFENIDYAFKAPQSNSLSVKIIYYLDYLNIQKALRKAS